MSPTVRQIILRSQGFSMVELMVVVSVIGILAVIAIPQYEKLQAKARRAEMKTSLSAVYLASKSFNLEYNGYSSNLKLIGFGHSGKVLYNIEFLMPCRDWDSCAPEFNGDRSLTNPSTPHRSIDICYSDYYTGIGHAPTLAESGCAMIGDLNPFTRIGIRSTLAGRVFLGLDETDSTRFAVTASAYILNGAWSHDSWRIDQTKMITQRFDGLR